MTKQGMSKPANSGQREEREAPSGSQSKKMQPKRTTKSDAVVALLSRSRGTTIDEMMKATA